MGTQNNGYEFFEHLNVLENKRRVVQSQIENKKNLEERKKLGQFSTPYELAKEIVSFGVTLLNVHDIDFLEPCVGTGVFYSALLSETHNKIKINNATGIEIDPIYHKISEELWSVFGLNNYNENFTQIIPDKQYNLVITNPPYVRHQYISPEYKTYLMRRAEQETGIRVSGLSGLYCYFMLLAHKWLAPNALCAWLIPGEFLDANYGFPIKRYLLNKVCLLRVHQYNSKNSMFQDAVVSSCVVWFRNQCIEDDYSVEFTFGNSHSEPLQRKLIKKSILNEESKWTRFPCKDIRNVSNKTKTTLGDFFEIKRGIATGDNKFFILSREQIFQLGMDLTFFKPILPSPRYLKTNFVTSGVDGLPLIDKQYFLLDCGDISEDELEINYPEVWRYLLSGIDKTSQKYLCRNRKKWYYQEKRTPANFLCSYMGRTQNNQSPVRFILNLSKAIASNSYLMLYPKDDLQKLISKNPNALFDIWNMLKKIDGNAITDEGRSYGGGLKKIEPNELAKVVCNFFL